jgi:hypothetical protein
VDVVVPSSQAGSDPSWARRARQLLGSNNHVVIGRVERTQRSLHPGNGEHELEQLVAQQRFDRSSGESIDDGGRLV